MLVDDKGYGKKLSRKGGIREQQWGGGRDFLFTLSGWEKPS